MSYDLLFKEALTFHENGQLDEAEAIYRRILNTAPKNPDVLNLLGLIAQEKGVHNQAVELFYKAYVIAPSHLPISFNLGLSLQALGKYREAIEAFSRVLIKESLVKIAGLYLLLDEKDKAKEFYKHAIEKDAGYMEALAGLAYLEEDTESLEAIEDASAFYYLARIYFDKYENYDRALSYARQVYELVKTDETLVFLGEICLKLGMDDEAKEYFSQCSKNCASAMINLANFEEGETAEEMYKSVIELEPDNWFAHFNYGRWLYLQKRLSEALEEYRKAVVINPERAEISNNLGAVLRDFNEFEEALGLFINASMKEPKRKEYAVNVVETLLMFARENKESALKIAQNWQKSAPNNTFAIGAVKILEGSEDIDREYFEELFDQFAEGYEETLAKINYNLPKIIASKLGSVEGTIVDLGCGSGLIGKELKSDKNFIIGIDLSQKMLDLAKKTGRYGELIKGDIVKFLNERKFSEATIIAADVFCYFGDLAPVIEACKGNKLCFSVEAWDGLKDHALSIAGRYKHRKDYVLGLLGGNATCEEITLRQENGEDVLGYLFIL